MSFPLLGGMSFFCLLRRNVFFLSGCEPASPKIQAPIINPVVCLLPKHHCDVIHTHNVCVTFVTIACILSAVVLHLAHLRPCRPRLTMWTSRSPRPPYVHYSHLAHLPPTWQYCPHVGHLLRYHNMYATPHSLPPFGIPAPIQG